MNTKLVVVLAVVLLAALVVDAASTKDRKNNKGDKGGKKDNKGGNKDNKKGGKDNKNVCLPVEGALKKAGFELCKLKLDKVEAMLERADELECFDWLVEEAMDKMKEMKDRGDEEEGEDDDEPAMDKAKEAGDDQEDEGDEDRAGKGKGNKKGKGKKDKKNKGGDDGEWEVDFEDLDIDDLMEEFGVDFDMLKRMKMRDIIRELGPCKRCKDDGCLRVNHWIGSKMMLVRDIIGMVEEWGGCPEMSSKQEEGTTAGRLPGP